MPGAPTLQIQSQFKPRGTYQHGPFDAWADGFRRFITLWHRRGGKDLTWWTFTWMRALERVGSYYYFLPTYRLCKQIIWDGMDSQGNRYLYYIPREVIVGEPNESELQVELINGSLIQLLSATDVDKSAIGTNACGIVFSEFSAYDTGKIWDFCRPIINENKGWAAFAYTPRGMNHGYDLWEKAQKSEKWWCDFRDVTMTKREDGAAVQSEEDIQDDRDSGMPEELIQQEYYLSFKGYQQGSYFAEQYQFAQDEQRIGSFPWRPAEPCYAVCDLGLDEKFAIWVWQKVAEMYHFIRFHELEVGGIPEFAKWVKQQPYAFEKFYAPFDIDSRDISTGIPRIQTARDLGIHFVPVPRVNRVEERVNAARMLWPRSCFDEKNCLKGLNALLNYRREYDEKRKEYKPQEVHDWASHGASAYCYAALANRRDVRKKKKVAEHFAVTGFDPFYSDRYETEFDPFED